MKIIERREQMKTKVLNQAVIKYIVIVLMVVDHTVCAFLSPDSPWYLAGRMISRLTGPTMAYFIAEGYFYTRNVKKYLTRLGIFAVISAVPILLLESKTLLFVEILDKGVLREDSVGFISLTNAVGDLVFNGLSVIFTLFLGLLAIYIWDKGKMPVACKIAATAAILYVSCFGDWKYWNILFCLAFWFLRDKKIYMWGAYIIIALTYIFNLIPANIFDFTTFEPEFKLYRIGTLLVIPFIALLYNGKPGKKSAFNKWFFYIFYPAHLLILWVISICIH